MLLFHREVGPERDWNRVKAFQSQVLKWSHNLLSWHLDQDEGRGRGFHYSFIHPFTCSAIPGTAAGGGRPGPGLSRRSQWRRGSLRWKAIRVGFRAEQGVT